MKRFPMPPAVRISIGLVMFTMTLVMGADMLGMLPDPHQATRDLCKKTCESLAVYASLAAQNDDFEAIKTTLQVLKKRNADIVSAALRTKTGQIITVVGDHASNWRNPDDALSTLSNVQVPVFKDGHRWGTFEICFQAAHGSLLAYFWAKPVVKLLTMLIPLGFAGFYLFMKKTLRHLDPSAVIPERVKVALDSLVEGVVLMDHRERIVLANKAFEKTMGANQQALMGKKTSELDWMAPEPSKKIKAFPWRQALEQGTSQAAIPLNVKKGDAVRTFMVNGAPIVDRDGKMRGALATFDDVTKLEAQNTKLQKMLNALKKSRDEIRQQNQTLQILATQDPLTHCLNRRAFFERFEKEFSRSRRYGHNISCVMVDIDHFKSINDNHGHPFGDKVLQKVSRKIKDCLRDSDDLCRYGGEEFCIMLPDTSLQGAIKTAERIRTAIATTKILGIQITISLGATALESDTGSPSELLDKADKALYKAKTSGRNRAVAYNAATDFLHDDTHEANRGDGSPHIPHHVVNALMMALEHRDVPTAEHSRKVGELCAAAAQGLMSTSECFVLEIAGQLHDIGKLGVPDSILLKPGPLTEDEWIIMRDHERRSVDVIASTFLSPALVEIVQHGSAWYDGSSSDDPGQPRGEDIPLGARILNIADAFHAIVSHRPYRPARSYDEAYKELRRCAGTQFDPELVEHFIEVVRARDETRRKKNLSFIQLHKAGNRPRESKRCFLP
jgi:diguanylate cyclase (GGDEF)-like protein/PAS domain S-box-containing protein